MLVATHDGAFHADETVACAIIASLYPDTKFSRSRDPARWAEADLVLDVSGRNDERHYDHHSPDFTAARANGIRYATAGLMWLKFGPAYLKRVAAAELPHMPADQVLAQARLRIDREMMEMVDLNDNGDLSAYSRRIAAPATADGERVLQTLNEFYQNDPTVPYLVAALNSPGNGAVAQDRAFAAAVEIVKTLLRHCALTAVRTEIGIDQVLQRYHGGPLLILHDNLPWSAAVLSKPEKFTECQLAVYPDRNGRWRVQSLQVSAAERFVNRLSAPPAWRGLDDTALEAVTGLKRLTFVHRSGFTGGALDFEACLALAQLWLHCGVRPPAPQA